MAKMELKQALSPVRGQSPTSKQMTALAEAVNSRILTGAGDAHWRIPYYIFSVFFRKPRLDDGTLYTPESEFFDFYQFVNPSADDIWPVNRPQTEEGANLQTNNLNKFVFGMNYERKEAGYYIYEREDTRAGFAQVNLASNASNFRGFTFPFFHDFGLAGDKAYSAFGLALEYLSNGYVNGNTSNPSGHSYGGYYGQIPEINSKNGCGSINGVNLPKSTSTIYEIGSSKKYIYDDICSSGAQQGKEYKYVSSSSGQYIVVQVNSDGSQEIKDSFTKNKHHVEQYNSNVFLNREIKNNILRLLYNYLSFAKGFDFDWFFNHQYAYAPEVGSFVSATAYYDRENNFLGLEDIIINRKRVRLSKYEITSSTETSLLVAAENQVGINDAWNKTIDANAVIHKKLLDKDYKLTKVYSGSITPGAEYIVGSTPILYENVIYNEGETFFGVTDVKFYTADDDVLTFVYLVDRSPTTDIGDVEGENTILQFLNRNGYLEKIPRTYLYSANFSGLKFPQGFTLQSFQVSTSNLKKFTVTAIIHESTSGNPEKQISEIDYSFDFSSGKNFDSRVIQEFYVGTDYSVQFFIKDIETIVQNINFTCSANSSVFNAANHGLEVKEILLEGKTLTQGVFYRVDSGAITFDGVVYSAGDTFLADMNDVYSSDPTNSSPVLYAQTGNHKIIFTSDNLPSPLSPNTVYEVKSVTASSFTLFSPGSSSTLVVTESKTGTFTKEAYINLYPIFLFAYKPKIEDAYALLRAATYYGTSDGNFSSSDHPLNEASKVCSNISEDLKINGYINYSTISQIVDFAQNNLHTKDNYELNSNAVFEAARRMSLYTRILKPDNYIGIADNKTLKFSRYAKQKYSWGRLQSSKIIEGSSELSLPYNIYGKTDTSSINNSTYDVYLNSYAGDTKTTTTIFGGVWTLLENTFNVAVNNNLSDDDDKKIIFDGSGPELLKNSKFLTNYYSNFYGYDFTNIVHNKVVIELNNVLVKEYKDQSTEIRNVNTEFSPLEFLPSFDCIVVAHEPGNTANDQLNFIYCRIGNAIGESFYTNANKNKVLIKKYFVKAGVDFPGSIYNPADTSIDEVEVKDGVFSTITEADLQKIIPGYLNPNRSKLFILILNRFFAPSKYFIGTQGISLFGVTDPNQLFSVNNFYYQNQGLSPVYNSYPFKNFEQTMVGDLPLINRSLQANVKGYPFKHWYPEIDDLKQNTPRPFLDVWMEAQSVYPAIEDEYGNFTNKPFVSWGTTAGMRCGSPVTSGLNVYTSLYLSETNPTSLTAFREYKVSGGKIEFNEVVYHDGQTFLTTQDGAYSKIGSPTLEYRNIMKFKYFNLKLNAFTSYDDGGAPSADDDADYSLRNLLNHIIHSFAKGKVYLNIDDGTFSPNNTPYNPQTDKQYINSSYENLLDLYNKCLAGFPIKFSNLDDRKRYFVDCTRDNEELAVKIDSDRYLSLNSNGSVDTFYSIEIYDSSNNPVANSKILFSYDESVSLPKLAEGQYLKFSIPVNRLCSFLEPKKVEDLTITSATTLYKGNIYEITGGAVKCTEDGDFQNIIYSFDPNNPAFNYFVSPVTGSFIGYDPQPGATQQGSLTRMYKKIDSFFNPVLYLSFINYFFITDATFYLDKITQYGNLSIKRKVVEYEETSTQTSLRDIFQGIVPDPDGVGIDDLYFGHKYLVKSGEIVHNSVVYTAPLSGTDYPTFTAVNRFYEDLAGGDSIVLPVDEDNLPDGIEEIPFPEGYSNEWALWLNFIPYNASSSSPMKEEVYAATGSPFYDRCHINSAAIPKSVENRHLNLSQPLARYVESPPSYRYMPLLNNKGQIFYANMIGNESYKTEREYFYASCKGIVEPYKIKRAYFKLNEPENVYIELDREIEGNAITTYRTDYNGLIDWANRGNGMGNVHFKYGDASITNANGINQIISANSNQYKGSYYPRFFFVKLIPKPYDKDNNDIPDISLDSVMDHEHVKQIELYIEAMREGFTANKEKISSVSCSFSQGHLTPPDYSYEQLFFDSTKFGGLNGNKWPSLLTFSPSLNTVSTSENLFGPLRNEDNPRGFGPLPYIGTYTEPFASLVNAVNNLKSFRVSLPQEYFATNKLFSKSTSQQGVEYNWERHSTAGSYGVYLAKFTSPTDISSDPLVSTTRFNLRRNDGFLSSVFSNMGYYVTSSNDNPRAAIGSSYIVEFKNIATVSVEGADPFLIANAYSTISEYLNNTKLSVPMAYTQNSSASVLSPVTELKITDINDGCGVFLDINGSNSHFLNSRSLTPSSGCVVTNTLTLPLLPLFSAKPYFRWAGPRGCLSTWKRDNVEQNEQWQFVSSFSVPYWSKDFESGSTTAADIFEGGWQVISPDLITQ